MEDPRFIEILCLQSIPRVRFVVAANLIEFHECAYAARELLTGGRMKRSKCFHLPL